MDSIRVAKVSGVLCNKAGNSTMGSLHLTAHHLIYKADGQLDNEMWVTYPLISLVTCLPQTLKGLTPVTFRCRTFETFTLSFGNEQEATDVFESVRELTVTTSVTQLYAFYYQPNPPLPTRIGWSSYSPREEFARMGVGSRTKAWRFSDINKDFSLCPTYPARLVIPTKISDITLTYACKYRSKCRIPTLAYLHWANYGTITRSSQPMVGLTNNRSVQDEKLIEAIFQSHRSPDLSHKVYGATATNLIIDARPTTNAMANVARGAGTENMDHYKEGKKAYLGVDNIHVMRDSLAKVVEALREADLIAAATQNLDPSDAPSTDKSFLDRQALRRSGWLRHISALLDGTVLIVRNIHVNSSHVLIHCSDGWDRTAQLSSLAQLCLDPHYRTIRGFEILIEKDWLSFGHRFLDRCGHLSSEKFFLMPNTNEAAGGTDAAQAFLSSVQNRFSSQHHLKETSPVFHQFLECVRQIQRQFPTRFEFNARFLERLHYHLYACQFGTFLFNNEQERRVGQGGPPPFERTVSAWDWFNTPEEMEKNKNETYDPSLDDPKLRAENADMGVLFPNPKNVRFWHELYGRTDEEMNGRIITVQANDAEVLGPTESLEDDNVLSSGDPPGRSPSTPPIPSTTETGRPAKGEGRSTLASVSTPSLPITAERPAPSRRESFRPFSSLNSAYSLETARFDPSHAPGPSSPLRPRRAVPAMPKLPESFTAGGIKSVWGKLSSNASAALSAVQDAYEGMAKEYAGSMMSSSSNSDVATSGELQVKHTSGVELSNEDTVLFKTTAHLDIDGNPWATIHRSSTSPISTRHLRTEDTRQSPPIIAIPSDSSVPQYIPLKYPTSGSPSALSNTLSLQSDRHLPTPSPLDIPLPPSRSSSVRGSPVPSSEVPERPPPGQQYDPLGVGWL